jgi:hypothetical protein
MKYIRVINLGSKLFGLVGKVHTYSSNFPVSVNLDGDPPLRFCTFRIEEVEFISEEEYETAQIVDS